MKLITIPNLMTLANLICGCIGIVLVSEGQLKEASIFMFIALLFDYFDGFVARLLKSSSEIGKQLDSLADVVSWGVLPAYIVFSLLSKHTELFPYAPYGAFILAAASALRLAKFNIDTRQSDSFIGLPTPANAMIIATFPYFFEKTTGWETYLVSPLGLATYVLVFSFLLNAELPLFALKFKDFSWKTNSIKYIFLIGSFIGLVLLQLSAIPLIIVTYILLSLYLNLKRN